MRERGSLSTNSSYEYSLSQLYFVSPVLNLNAKNQGQKSMSFFNAFVLVIPLQAAILVLLPGAFWCNTLFVLEPGARGKILMNVL